MGHHGIGVFLEVVRRERVLLLVHECLEEAPRAPGGAPQQARLLWRQTATLGEPGRHAQPPRQDRCQRPHRHQRPGHRPRGGPDHGDEHAGGSGKHHAPPKVPVEGTERQIHSVSGLRSGDPLQQLPLADIEAPQRARHGVGDVRGAVRERRKGEQHLERRQVRVSAGRAQMAALRNALAPWDHFVEHRHEGRQGDGDEDQRGPEGR